MMVMIDEKNDLTILLTLSLYTSPSHLDHALYVTSRVTPLSISIITKKKTQSRHSYDTPPAQRLLSRVPKIFNFFPLFSAFPVARSAMPIFVRHYQTLEWENWSWPMVSVGD